MFVMIIAIVVSSATFDMQSASNMQPVSSPAMLYTYTPIVPRSTGSRLSSHQSQFSSLSKLNISLFERQRTTTTTFTYTHATHIYFSFDNHAFCKYSSHDLSVPYRNYIQWFVDSDRCDNDIKCNGVTVSVGSNKCGINKWVRKDSGDNTYYVQC